MQFANNMQRLYVWCSSLVQSYRYDRSGKRGRLERRAFVWQLTFQR